MPRFYCPAPLQTGLALGLPAGAARHVQVLRLQPGDVITLFNGEGGEFDASITRMGRSDVDVEVGAHRPLEREAPRAVHLLAGITANERMDWLVEKATELGVASITPLMAERAVQTYPVRADGEKLTAEDVRAALLRLDPALEDAARMLGRSPVAVVLTVTLRQARTAAIGGGLTGALLIGAAQGYWIAYWRIPSFIVTLAGMLVFRGLTLWLQDDTFIKLKPTIVNCLFGVILGGGLLLAINETIHPDFKTPIPSGNPIIQIAEPFDGVDNSYMVTPCLAHIFQKNHFSHCK